MDEQLIIHQILQGDKNAFRLLVIRYEKPLFSFIRKFHFPQERVEEIAQESFLKVYSHLHTFDPKKGSFSSFLFTVAKNLSLNEYKKNKRKKETSYEEASLFIDESEKENPIDISRLNSLILNLPQNFKSALLLSNLEGLSLKEISTIENCEIGTLKSRIHRAKKMLTERLFKHEGKA